MFTLDEKHEHFGKQVRVILLEAVNEAAKRKAQFKAASISTRGYRFDREAA